MNRRGGWRCSDDGTATPDQRAKTPAENRRADALLASGSYLDRRYREQERRHNDGVNRLVVRFAREGVAVGWRGEINVPGLTQVRPDLLVRVSQGTLGPGFHCIEFERQSAYPRGAERKLGPYLRMAGPGVPCPC